MRRRSFLKLASLVGLAPLLPKIPFGALTKKPAPVVMARGAYADLFATRLGFIDDIIISNYMTDNTAWFLLTSTGADERGQAHGKDKDSGDGVLHPRRQIVYSRY